MTGRVSSARQRMFERHRRGDYSGPTIRDRVYAYVVHQRVGAVFTARDVNAALPPRFRDRMNMIAHMLHEAPFVHRVGDGLFERIEGSSYWMRDPGPAGDLRPGPARLMSPSVEAWIRDMQEQDPDGLGELWIR